MSILTEIQAELKAPKNQYNSFGKYKYRSCEDILEALKPILKKHNAVLTLSDSVEAVGERVYIKSTATFKVDGEELVEATGYAREAETKKGMDESQITGSASSYARKYALNGLFLIDDTKDADTMDNRQSSEAFIQSANNQSIPTEKKTYVCVDCGKPFEGFTDRNGRFWNAGQVYHLAISSGKKAGITDGKARCRNCLNKKTAV